MAEVNGAPATIDGGNFLFRAVRVNAGSNTVMFTYHPFGIPWLVVLGWTTLAIVCGWTIVAVLRSRRTAMQASLLGPERQAIEPEPMAPIATEAPTQRPSPSRRKRQRR